MKKPTIIEIENALYNAAIPSIEKYIKENTGHVYLAFAVETLAEESYFHMCALAYDDCNEDDFNGAPIPDCIEWSCQEWPDFDFNLKCNIWGALWEPMRLKIRKFDEYVSTLSDAEQESHWETSIDEFKLASKSAFKRIISSGVLDKLLKETCFSYFIYEHHDVF